MTYLSHTSLQQAIYQTLTGDAALSAIISGIYDHVPQGNPYPFITIGEANIRDWSNLEKPGSEHQFTIRVFSRESGRKQSADIISVSGSTLVQMQCTGSTIALMDDGATYRGTLGFRALLSAA